MLNMNFQFVPHCHNNATIQATSLVTYFIKYFLTLVMLIRYCTADCLSYLHAGLLKWPLLNTTPLKGAEKARFTIIPVFSHVTSSPVICGIAPGPAPCRTSRRSD